MSLAPIRELAFPAVDMYAVGIYIEDGVDAKAAMRICHHDYCSLLGIAIAKGGGYKGSNLCV